MSLVDKKEESQCYVTNLEQEMERLKTKTRRFSCSTQLSMKFQMLIKSKMLKNKDFSCFRCLYQVGNYRHSRRRCAYGSFMPGNVM